MRWIPPGSFWMGSPESEAGRWQDEGPRHRVTLTEGFWLGEMPCTQELWQEVMGENPSRFCSPDRPVESVSWEDCQRFLKKLGAGGPGPEFRLPTEAEWEYACRAATETSTYAGELEILGKNDAPLLDGIAWYGGNSRVGYELKDGLDSSDWPEKQHPHTRAGTRPVGLKAPNAWGLHDMLGNVWEWCQDWRGSYSQEDAVDPPGPAMGSYRVVRGGSWGSGARYVRAAARVWDSPGSRGDSLGFRLARGQGAPAGQAGGGRGAGRSEARDEPASPARRPPGAGEGPLLLLRSDRQALELRPFARPEWASAAGRDRYGLWLEFEVESVSHRLRWIPPGRFWMGSPEGEAGRRENEGPRHPVTLTQGFWLGEVPCTQALWQAVMGENPSRFRSPDRPVESVSWENCQQFLRQLESRLPGLQGRLPTEAEWEYACRAGTETSTYAGELEILGANNAPLLDGIAWYGGNSGEGYELEEGHDTSKWPEKQYPHTKAGTRPVRGKPANPWGLYDTLGNVWEWCQDWGGSYSVEAVVDPAGPEQGSSRVVRGGSWIINARLVRAAARFWYSPGSRGDGLGFRLARGQAAPGGGAPGTAGPTPRRGPARDDPAPPGRGARVPKAEAKK
ncbi:MAG: formylglycine-generating enzyme family protein [Thermoanaerobaculia bacterium]